MIKRLLLPLALLLALLPALALAHEGDPAAALHIDSGVVHEGDLSTLDQPIVVDGSVRGDVTSLSGQIVIRGSVSGDVVSWGGDVLLGGDAQVSGSVMALAGSVREELSTQVEGAIFNGNLDQAGFASLIPGGSSGELSLGTRLALATVLLLLGVVIGALMGRLWRRAADSAATVIRLVPLRAFVLGLLTSVLFVVAMALLFLLLTLSLVGIVIAPFVLLALHIPLLLAVAGAGKALERWLNVGWANGVAGLVLLLLAPFLLAIWQPIAGFVAFHLVAAAGTGALLLLRSATLRFQSV